MYAIAAPVAAAIVSIDGDAELLRSVAAKLVAAGRDAILALHHDDTLRVITSSGEETTSAPPPAPLYPAAVREILDAWQRGAPPPTSVHDCLKFVRLIDQAYALVRRDRE